MCSLRHSEPPSLFHAVSFMVCACCESGAYDANKASYAGTYMWVCCLRTYGQLNIWYFRSRPPHPGRTRPLPDQLDHGVERRAQLEAAELDELLHGGMERHVGEDCVGSAVCQ